MPTNASGLANFAGGLDETLTIDGNNNRVGIATTNPQGTLQVGTGVTIYGNSGIVSATEFYGDGSNLSGISINYAPTAGIATYATTAGIATYATTAGIATNAQGLTGTPNIAVNNITGAAATFTDNVSIAGTLTYEDVTNVDSIGIITARSGVRITTGGLIVTAGVSTFKGADFDGGSLLKEKINITAGKLSDNTNINIDNGMAHLFTTTETTTSTTISPTGNSVTNNQMNANGDEYVAYCWAPVDGYSSFGSYTGNGSADGPFVYTGFRPKYLVLKKTSASGEWVIWDSARRSYNWQGPYLLAESSVAENSGSEFVDFLSNGFKLRTTNSTLNGSGATSVYIAFAENPFALNARAR